MARSSHAGLKAEKRYKKAKQILKIISHFKDIKSSKVLDIGTGSGHIAEYISKQCKSITSIDIVDERVIKIGYTFKKVTNEKLPFKKETFDIVISNQVLEHVINKQQHLQEIKRVLKKGGICYLATPNKYSIIEPHHHLPFLSWLPKRAASIYLKITRNKQWDVDALAYSKIKELAKTFSGIIDMTPKVLKNPKQYHLDTSTIITSITKRLPLTVLKSCVPAMPSFIFILRK